MRERIIAVNSNCYHGYSIEEAIAGIKAAGADMAFYSYHLYDSGATMDLVSKKKYDAARLSGVNKLRYILQLHNEMLADFGLPKRKVFLNELGRARTTGIDGDSLYNAAGLITYLLAFGCEDEPELYPFPWCTFHNPNLQISFTQFLLCDDGSYAMTPNGVAIKMLHSLRGERLGTTVSEALSRDSEYCAVAVEDEEGVSLIVVNTSGETVIGELEIEGMPEGEYVIKGHLCDSFHNNIVTGKTCTGKAIDETAEAIRKVGADETFRHFFSLEKNAFNMYKILKRID